VGKNLASRRVGGGRGVFVTLELIPFSLRVCTLQLGREKDHYFLRKTGERGEKSGDKLLVGKGGEDRSSPLAEESGITLPNAQQNQTPFVCAWEGKKGGTSQLHQGKRGLAPFFEESGRTGRDDRGGPRMGFKNLSWACWLEVRTKGSATRPRKREKGGKGGSRRSFSVVRRKKKVRKVGAPPRKILLLQSLQATERDGERIHLTAGEGDNDTINTRKRWDGRRIA